MPKIKLTPEDVRGIIYAHNQGATLGTLATIYRVSRTQIWRIVNKKQHRSIAATQSTDSSLRSQSGEVLPSRTTDEQERKLQRELLRFLKARDV